MTHPGRSARPRNRSPPPLERRCPPRLASHAHGRGSQVAERLGVAEGAGHTLAPGVQRPDLEVGRPRGIRGQHAAPTGRLEAETPVEVRLTQQADERLVERPRRGEDRVHQRTADALSLPGGQDSDRTETEHRTPTGLERGATAHDMAHDCVLDLADQGQPAEPCGRLPQVIDQPGLRRLGSFELGPRERRGVQPAHRRPVVGPLPSDQHGTIMGCVPPCGNRPRMTSAPETAS